jgi:hypothetical protein
MGGCHVCPVEIAGALALISGVKYMTRKIILEVADYLEARADIAAELAPVGKVGEGFRRALKWRERAKKLRERAGVQV